MAEKRTDAERRIRQVERFSRLLRVLNCISGSGRWDAEALAKELECSRRTVHRLLQTLSLAGVPWYFDDNMKAYRIRPGFRFNLLAKSEESPDAEQGGNAEILERVETARDQAQALATQLQEIYKLLAK